MKTDYSKKKLPDGIDIGVEPIPFSFDHTILDKALMKAEEIADRALLKLLVLDETADAIYNKKDLYGDCITIGIRQADNTSSFMTALQYSVGETHPERLEKTDYGYLAKIKVEKKLGELVEVPVKIRVFQNYYPFIHPDVLDARLYGYVYYYFPNPYALYLEARKDMK